MWTGRLKTNNLATKLVEGGGGFSQSFNYKRTIPYPYSQVWAIVIQGLVGLVGYFCISHRKAVYSVIHSTPSCSKVLRCGKKNATERLDMSMARAIFLGKLG